MSTSPDRTSMWLGAVIAFLATAGIGWTIGKSARDTEKTEAASSEAPTSAMTRASERANTAKRRVVSIRQGGSEEERMRATIELANSLSTKDFAEWIDGGWFDFRSGFELTLFRRIVEERWRIEDPEGFVAWCLKDGRHGGGWSVSNPRSAALPLLSEWAADSPERLKAFFDKYPDDDLEAQVIGKLAKTNPAAALARFQEMIKRGARTYQLQNALQKLAQSAPSEVEGILDQLPTSYRMQAEGFLVGQRLKDDFDTEFQALLTRPDGWQLLSRNFHQVKDASSRILEELPNLPASWRNSLVSGSIQNLMYQGDSEKWFHADLEGAGFTDAQAQRIRSYALRILASKKPEVVVELMAEGGLDESSRLRVVRDVFRSLRNKPDQADQLIAQLSTEAERQAAQSALGTGSQATTPNRQFNTPSEWLEVAVSDDLGQQGSWQLAYALQRWDQQKLTELTEQFGELPAEQKDAVAGIVAGQNSSFGFSHNGLAGEVIRHLLSTPQEDASPENGNGTNAATRLASSTAVRWVVDSPTEATEWVASLPAGEARLWAQKNMAVSWANYDPDAVTDWVATLPAETRSEVQTFMQEQSGN